jgi:hypothetical protein
MHARSIQNLLTRPILNSTLNQSSHVAMGVNIFSYCMPGEEHGGIIGSEEP